MSSNTFQILTVVFIVIGLALLFLSHIGMHHKQTMFIAGIIILIIAVAGRFIIVSEIGIKRICHKSDEISNYRLDETIYMDPDKEIVIHGTIGVGITMDFIDKRGSDTTISLLEDYSRYEIIPSEDTKIEVYTVTVTYRYAFVYQAVDETYYKIYINNGTIPEGMQTE